MTDTEDLFQRNLDYFWEINPDLAKRLDEHAPLSSIVTDDDDEPDVLFQDMRLYGKGARKFAKEQWDSYWQSPGVATLSEMTVTSMDLEGDRFRTNLEAYAKDHDITFNEHRTTRQAFHLIVLGVGLGQHLEALLDEVRPRSLFLIEPNLEFLYHSLSYFDWKGVIGALIEDGVRISILTDKRADNLISEVRRIYTETGRASFDGITVYRHYESAVFEAVERFIATEGSALFSGLGFFEDELNMIANTYNNLKSGEEKVFLASLEPKDMPIFVIGSGPSLDGALEIIRANQDKAVIISCGTALLPLLQAGIRPDFHAELERSKFQMEIPQTVARKHDLSDIVLIGSTTLVPGVKQVFEKRVFYFRHMLSSFPEFSGNLYNCLRYPSPVVGNTGVSFGQDSGFRKFYLFGMDLGFVDSTAHHSTASVYLNEDGDFPVPHVEGTNVVRGNFGGEVQTTEVLDWARDTMEVSMKVNAAGFFYHNCSDGAMIKGTLPLLPEFVDLPTPTVPKTAVLQEMMDGFPCYSQEDFNAHWQDGKVIQEVRELGDQLIACIRENSDLQTKRYLTALGEIAPPLAFNSSALQILRGSLHLMLVLVEYYVDRMEQSDKKAGFTAFLAEELCAGIDAMCDEVEAEFTALKTTGALLNRETVWE